MQSSDRHCRRHARYTVIQSSGRALYINEADNFDCWFQVARNRPFFLITS